MKLSIQEIELVLEESLDAQKAVEVINKLQALAKEKEEEKSENKTPKSKNQYGVIVFEENGQISKDAGAVVFQILESEDITTSLTKISNAARNYNQNTKKGGKFPVQTIGEAVQKVKRKFYKAEGINIKSGNNVIQILTSNNKLV